jgi:endonuclease/exonuclease/phosphatase family metal-dependent hydrolase
MMGRRIMKLIGLLISFIILFAGGMIVWLSVSEYRPAPVEEVEIEERENNVLNSGEEIRLVIFHLGYGALGKDADFFMVGGKSVRPEDASVIRDNLAGMTDILMDIGADINLLQEVDTDSKRSYGIDQTKELSDSINSNTAFALNFSCKYVPFPLEPIGKVNSGLYTMSQFSMDQAQRISLPCPFRWPVRIANLKRCLLVTRIELGDSDKQLVVVNLHLEAYDDGEGRKEQLGMLADLLREEYEKGNYVIAGGDFNSCFPDADANLYPVYSDEYFKPAEIDRDVLPEGFRWVYDENTPTSRLLNSPYDEDAQDTQLYVIDGYILSDNLETISVETQDRGFAFSDHNPVVLDVVLRKEEP